MVMCSGADYSETRDGKLLRVKMDSLLNNPLYNIVPCLLVCIARNSFQGHTCI